MNWKTLRRVIRKAKHARYASELVDGAFLYVALYDENGVTEELIKRQELIDDLLGSGLLPPEDRERNALIVSGVPPAESNAMNLFLPYYLYSIPRTAIFDLLRGRLVLLVLTNPGRVIAALERHGFPVSIKLSPPGGTPLDNLVVTHDFTDTSGAAYRMEMHNLSFHVNELIYEFKSIQYLVEVVQAMRDTAPVAVRARQGDSSP